MKTSALAALTLALLLAGCGAVPTHSLPAQRAFGNAVGARTAQQLELRIPAHVMGYVDAHLDGVRADLAKERVQDMYGRDAGPRYELRFNAGSLDDLKLVASQDGFKSKLSEVTMYTGRRHFEGKELVVPFSANSGRVTYYLEVRASVHRVGSGKLERRLPVHHISNHGRNFEAALTPGAR